MGDIMTTVTATRARHNLFRMISTSARGHVPIQITSKRGNVVMISKVDYEGLLETLTLLSSPKFIKSIRLARADIKAGRTKSLKEVFGR